MTRRRIGRSVLVRGAAMLLLGVATTFIIAWPATMGAWYAGWVKPALVPQGTRAFSVAGKDGVYRAYTYRGVLIERYQVVAPSSRDSRAPVGEPTVLAGWVATPSSAPEDLRGSVSGAETWATGLPFRCAAGEVWNVWRYSSGGIRRLATAEEILHAPATGITSGPVPRHSWSIATSAKGRVEAPLRIVWGGLAADVAAWSVAWGAALFGLVWARRVWRRRRGLCGACGYDLRGAASAACPECGAAGAAA